MVIYKDYDQLRKWLGGRPPGDSALIATRAALRVLPLVASGVSEFSVGFRREILLPIFRVATVANFFGAWPFFSRVAPAAFARIAIAANTAAHAMCHHHDGWTAQCSNGTWEPGAATSSATTRSDSIRGGFSRQQRCNCAPNALHGALGAVLHKYHKLIRWPS